MQLAMMKAIKHSFQPEIDCIHHLDSSTAISVITGEQHGASSTRKSQSLTSLNRLNVSPPFLFLRAVNADALLIHSPLRIYERDV